MGIGYGGRSDFTNTKQLKQVPGAKYNQHEINSLSYQSIKNNPKTMHGFYNKFDAYEKTCHQGMEQHYYGRETKGPGAYLKQEFIYMSPTAKAS